MAGRRFVAGKKSLAGSVVPLTELEEVRDSYVEEEVESGTTIENLSVSWSRRSATLPVGRDSTGYQREFPGNSESVKCFTDGDKEERPRKSFSTVNTLAPTAMTCIKSPRAMSEHLLGQSEIHDSLAPPGTQLSVNQETGLTTLPTPSNATRVLVPHGFKSNSLKDHDRQTLDRTNTETPRQRWSSVRVKGGSTKSLLLENGGPQAQAMKGTITKEVYNEGVLLGSDGG